MVFLLSLIAVAANATTLRSKCDLSLTSRLKNSIFHRMQLYVTGRGLEDYERISKKNLLKTLDALPGGARWTDLGAGEAKALNDYDKRRKTLNLPPLKLAAVVLHRTLGTKIKNLWAQESPVQFYSGKPFEDYAPQELPLSDIITDFMGAIHYSEHADQVLNQALRNLKKGGLFITNASLATEIRDESGKIIGPHEWAARGKGIVIEPSDWYVLKVRKLSDTAEVPALRLTKISEPSPFAPPMREYTIEKVNGR